MEEKGRRVIVIVRQHEKDVTVIADSEDGRGPGAKKC